ncbi:hypothetical protein [Paenibacillus sp. MBLB4367]|uniref:hypothetical protein n=1 Tax=Paenibacillus sp. MBLB4367 TaxID=3384767 RepID=UPI00390830EA
MSNDGRIGRTGSIPLLFRDHMYAELRIIEVKGNASSSRPACVEVEAISSKCMRFVTELSFPVGPFVVLAINLTIVDRPIRLKGYIVYSRRKRAKNEYELVLTIDETTRVELRDQLHKLAMLYVPHYMKAEYYYHFFAESSYDFANHRINLLM